MVDCKILLRTGAELVMERSSQFTVDPYYCWKIFSQYYPRKADEMHQVLELFVNPKENDRETLSFLCHFGDWMVKEVEKELI